MPFDHTKIEPKWQKYWDENKTFKTDCYDDSKPKYYCMDMFPYPSGNGLHVGHPEGYTATDIVSRMKRMQGYNVLHPMGFDSFGLPAEQFAIQTGHHPAEFTKKNIDVFRKQIKSLGFSYDWDREIATSDPEYYKWTQWIFTKLYDQGLAYIDEIPVNWCPELKAVLANEEVIDGKSERGGYPVIRKPMRQWVLKITEYAERLLADLDDLDWPEATKQMQRNWIGKSIGANVDFKIDGTNKVFTVFTTRCDTLFGATYCVMAPEHPYVEEITTDAQKAEIIKNAQANYPITLTDAEKALLIATAQSTATQTAINTALATAKTTAEQTAVATAVAVAQKVATETAETTAVETAQQIATQTAITTALTTAQSTATTTAMQTSTTVAKQVGNQAKKTFTNQVVSQMNTLGNGLNQLTSGLSQLNEGANTLANGTNQVNDGASTLADGTNQVNDGATTLAEGIKTFNEEGIKKICNYINGDVKDLTTRVQKLTDLSKEYNNFTMLDGENDGEVKFIMIADAVKKQEDSEQNKEEAVLSTNVINEENK